MRVPFDSLTLAAVVHELQPLRNARLQRIVQPDEHTIVLGFYTGSKKATGDLPSSEINIQQSAINNAVEAFLLISVEPEFARTHLISGRPEAKGATPPAFCMTMRSRLMDTRLRSIEQVGLDRILRLELEGGNGIHTVVVELMGKHSNVILVDEQGKVVQALKPVSKNKSIRPVMPGMSYELPPTMRGKSILDARPGDDLKQFDGASPFLLKLMAATPSDLEAIQRIVRVADFHPVFSAGNGAYPISVAPLGLPEFPRSSMSIALEQHYALEVPKAHAEQLRASLRGQVERVLNARETALHDLRQAKEAGAQAPFQQMVGELLLAFGSTVQQGAEFVDVMDYEGKPLRIVLDPEKTPVENAQVHFDKAKKAKARQGLVGDQIARMEDEKLRLEGFLAQLERAERPEQVEALFGEAREHRWLHSHRAPTAKKEDRPFEGHKIRELLGPGGIRVLYGENATSNDFLTLRVAKPDDWWVHVRGSASAHVIIQTGRHPEKVGREGIMFAAKVAVMNSPSKHAGYVPVDYTLKRYVRKPHGAPPGTALYTHEKTVHVEG